MAGFGVYVPQGRETAEQVAARAGISPAEVEQTWGVSAKAAPAREDQPDEMARLAALAALEQAEMDPGEIGVLLWSGEEYKDYIAQTASIRLQKEVGALNAWAFDLVGQGTTLMVGMRVAADLMTSDPEIGAVLIAGGSRNVDLVDYANPDTRWLLSSSAAGGAVVLKRGLAANRLVGFGLVPAAHLADEVAVPAGGTAMPFSLEVLNTPAMFYQVENPALVDEYWRGGFADDFCRALGLAFEDADRAGQKAAYLAARHLPPAVKAQVLNRLGLSQDNSADLSQVGFTGAADPLISLQQGLAKGAIKSGDLVALAGAGHGFCHAACLMEWG